MGIFGTGSRNQARYSDELHNLKLTQAVYGTTHRIVIGTRRVSSKLLFYAWKQPKKSSSGGGKGFGGGKYSSQYEYFADVQFALGSASATEACRGILNVWDQQGKLANRGGTFSFTVPSGGGSITPTTGDAPVQMDLGVSKLVSYSVTADDYGSGGVRTLTGTQFVPMRQVVSSPAAGEYTFDPAISAYGFSAADVGAQVVGGYSSVFSLYYRSTTQAAQVPATGPYQVSTDNQPYFYANDGVVDVETGNALVAGVDYSVSGGVYTFSASWAGKYVYINYTFTSNDSSITNSSTLNLTFFDGALGQTPWPYMQSKYPSAAFGYPGISHAGANPMALGSSGMLTSYNYELVGLNIFPGGGLDAHLCDTLKMFLTDPFLSPVQFPNDAIGDWTDAYAYLAANNYFISAEMDTQTSIADAMSRPLEVGNIGAFVSEGKLKLASYGDTTCVGNGYTYTPKTTPVAVLTWDDLLPPSDEGLGETSQTDPIEFSEKAPQDCWNIVSAQFLSRAHDYNITLVNAQNDAFIAEFGRRAESQQNWDWISDRTVAAWALDLHIKRECYIRGTSQFYLSSRFAYIEQMDLVQLPTGEVVRIKEIADDPDGRRTLDAEQWTYGSANSSIYPKQDPSRYEPTWSLAIPGDTYPVIFEASPQSVLARPNTIQIAVAGNDLNWGGCDIFVSDNGTAYSHVDRVKSLNRTGLLASLLPTSSDPDTTDVVTVDMSLSNGELVSATVPQADAFVTLSAIVDPAGGMELVSYETANLVAANRYQLSYLRRGVYGTTIGTRGVGSMFSYIGVNGVYEYQYPSQYAGKTIYFKFASFNLADRQMQDLSMCKAYAFDVPGTSVQPPSSGVFTTDPPQPLTAQVSGSAAQITVLAFMAKLNNLAKACTVAAPIGSLNQDQSYFVYYVDLAFEGGSISPIATQNSNDFLGKVGYYQLLGPNPDGSITTPVAGSSGVFRPSRFDDAGDFTTVNPAYVYDANPSTYAKLEAKNTSVNGPQFTDCTFSGFPSVAVSSSRTLTVIVDLTVPAASNPSEVIVTIGTSVSTIFSSSTTTSSASYTTTVPSGTNLSTIQVECTAGVQMSTGTSTVRMNVYDVNVQ